MTHRWERHRSSADCTLVNPQRWKRERRNGFTEHGSALAGETHADPCLLRGFPQRHDQEVLILQESDGVEHPRLPARAGSIGS